MKRIRRRRLFCSFSGGKSSAKMTEELQKQFHLWDEVCILFANTGQEDEKTLQYVNEISKHYELPTVWVEAVIDPRPGKGTTHKVVTFDTACRDISIFEDMCAKYGLPNTSFSHCTRELKLNPMTSYLRSLGWEAGSYDVAVGIRADEIDRMSLTSMAKGIFYPLIEAGVTKADVLAWEAAHPVRLGIPEHRGNCTWCWKKSDRKLATVFSETPSAVVAPKWLEFNYPNSGAGEGERRMFRRKRTAEDLAALARQPGFVPFTDDHQWQDDSDTGGSCGDSCEIGVGDEEDSL